MTKEEIKAYRIAKVISFLFPLYGFIMAFIYITKGEGSKSLGVLGWALFSFFLGLIGMSILIKLAVPLIGMGV